MTTEPKNSRCRRYPDWEHRDIKLYRRQLSPAIHERDYFLLCVDKLQRLCRPCKFDALSRAFPNRSGLFLFVVPGSLTVSIAN